ncbi:cupin domain-containing protein [Peptoniphilus sp. KCTC 25270]|uniref:cupin domain-containing protein n=1 Tax=Peptoniphilus sp. KCTC 25270 TaxID=2897414 RepID=UPI001E3D16E9|nr:cupin domain-containing protein [Peptoniphilus sp. KCTC 25270]MCD1147468.1 cupin domain-containing protein [Peptoniphilus sp. KCTC 25270]
MKTAKDWIQLLKMEPHIEGGYFKEMAKSEEKILSRENRALYTSIYFLLEEDNPSHFHRLTADEVWYFHEGEPLTIHMFSPEGKYSKVFLGTEIEKGQHLQFVVPKHTIFGSSVESGYALVSCMVSPGFEYSDFELMKRKDLLENYPEEREIIEKLTRK